MKQVFSSNDRAAVAQRIAALPPEKRAMLTGLLTKEGLNQGEPAPIPRRTARGPVPLSFSQQRLWFLDQLTPGSPAYIICSAYRLAGRLNVEALGRSLNRLVQRHELLRTTFAPGQGESMQMVAPSLMIDLPVIDLRAMPESEREAAVADRVRSESRQPFDLERGPLVRATLIRIRDDDQVLLLTLHHIVIDVFSSGLLVGELAALYEAFANGRPDPLAELPIQYADFAVWQRQWLQGQVLEQHLSYWREQLKDLPVLALPADHPRPSEWSGRGAAEPILIPPAIADQLHKLSQAENASLFMTLLAAFNVLLHRYTGQDDIVVGCPVANRTRPETAGLIGFFANTLVLRTRPDGKQSFRMLLRQAREVALGAIAHQELPFEKLVEELEPARSLRHNPLFQVMFTVQDSPPLALPGLSMRRWSPEIETTRFDLEVYLHHDQGALAGGIVFSTDLFDRATIRRMVSHFRQLLERLADDPDQPIGQVPFLTEAEPKQLLVEWNQTERPYPNTEGLAELFRGVAQRRASACAVQYGTERLSYGELDRRSNRFARYLRKQGVAPGQLVGLYAERSVEFIVALLGIVKAGGAYLPVDLSYPASRARAVLADGRIKVGVTYHHLLDAVAEMEGVEWICLDQDQEAIRGESDAEMESSAGGENLAYVMYTSGSTGEPKGVCVPQRAVSRLVLNTDYVALTEGDVVAQTSNVAFDAATFEVWGALLNGAKLVGISKDVALSPSEFANELKAHGVSTLFLTTALFNQMVQEASEAFTGVKHLLFGGEAVDVRRVREVLANGRPRRLLHVYGPTETTTFATWHEVKEVSPNATTVPIGRPLANTELFVLDGHMQPVPVGVVGELFIGGDGLALGYWQRPELTAERFVEHPFKRGTRLYRTGDLVRYRADGNVEFVGRNDNQVKLRGFRVELGEIESVLRGHERVQECVVVVRQEEPGDKQLVGYVVAEPGGEPDVMELRRHLERNLPAYMVPSAFVFLKKLPLTQNGKVDRGALPAPDSARRDLSEIYVAPRTAVEAAVAEIWSELLQVDRVGAHDNFFDLGGHSLTATRVISKVRTVFDVGLPLRVLFDEPTVAALSRNIEDARGVARQPEVKWSRHNGEGTRVLSFAQQRLWFLDRLGVNAYTIRLALRLEGALNVVALERALNEIVRRHDVLRARFDEQDGRPCLGIVPDLKLALTVEDWRGDSGLCDEASICRRASQEAERPMNLRTGPLLRAGLARLGEQEHLLWLAVHHIVADGWSFSILLRELDVLYEAYAGGRPSPLPELAMQYPDFADWQRQWLNGAELESQLDYWRSQLRGAPPSIELPFDRPRPQAETHRGGMVRVHLGRGLTGALKKLSQQEEATLFMTLLAGFQALLQRYSGQEDLVVGTPIANRRWTETEGLIGCFVNTLALRTRLNGDPTFRELLARVREVSLGAYDHQDLPFEKVIEALQPDRDLGRNPIFHVMFAFQNVPEIRPALKGLTFRHQELEWVAAQFDLSFGLHDGPEGITGTLEYSTDVFDAATVERLVGHYETLLAGAVADPDCRLSQLPLLPEAERNQLLVAWNRTERDYPQEVCLPNLLAEQVRRKPQAVAVAAEGREMTYAELDTRANQLSHYLSKCGVGPDVLVAMCMEPCLEMLVGLLGVLKAGGAYLPLDPAYPKERLDFMLGQSEAPLVLTLRRNAGLLPETTARVICLDADCQEIGDESAQPLISGVRLEHLAWVIYTSGSTGRPKGVMIPHRAVSNYLFWLQERFCFTESDRVLQLASLSFDVAAVELYAPLRAGARVVLPKPNTAYDPTAVVAAVREQGITVLQVVPSMLRLLVQQKEFAACTSLRLVLCGGETLTPDLQKAFFSVLPGAELYNLYGPTETCVDAAFWQCRPGVRGLTVPIGRPLANVQAYILDPHGQPVPVGVRGELYVGGTGMARGYLKDDTLTAEKFIPNPFGPAAGGRLYRTGDAARYDRDGAIEFLGRLDQQVKIHGLRIELEEIQAVLQGHAPVQHCVVEAREDTPGEKRLVAYVVPQPHHQCETEAARRFLAAKLPAYMVPSAFVLLEKLPLLLNGKVDRRALPSPEPVRRQSPSIAHSPVEELVATIWRQVLQIEEVGVQDNFFELGGHSLLATQVISRIEKAFQIQVPLRVLFENPTVAALATTLIRFETQPGHIEKIARLLNRIDAMSPEERQARLERKPDAGRSDSEISVAQT